MIKKALVAVALLSSCNSLTEDRAPTADCLTGSWWVGGDTGSAEMHPGRDCVGCHKREDGPPLALGGTIYPAPGQADECGGVEGVTVEVRDANGKVTNLVTNAAGNFFIEGDESVVAKPYGIRLTAGLEPPSYVPGTPAPAPIPMLVTKPLTGDCHSCHFQGVDALKNVAAMAPPTVIRQSFDRIHLKHNPADYLGAPAMTAPSTPPPAAGGMPATGGAPTATGGTGGI